MKAAGGDPGRGKGPRVPLWLVVACGALLFVGAFMPLLVRLAFRWSVVRNAIAYEDFYRKNEATCYRMDDMEPESRWFFTMSRDDYASALFDLGDHPSPDVHYWARRTLVRGYPDSPLAEELVHGWLDDPGTDMEYRLGAALVLADWGDDSRLDRQREVFGAAPEGNQKYWLGLHLASLGEVAGLRYALTMLASRPEDLCDEIGKRLAICV